MKKTGGYWMSMSDMMSAMMIIFLFISVAFMMDLQSQQAKTDTLVEGYAETKGNIYNALSAEFAGDLGRWDAAIDEKTLSIRFQNPEILFAKGSSNLTPQFQQILNEFLPRYIAVLARPEYRGIIQEIRIEGHTSSEWQGQQGTDAAYFGNMELSQARTRSVLRYAMLMPALQGEKEWLRQKITANGLSYSQPITVNGVESPELSRRVEFRIRTNAEEKMEVLKGYYDAAH